MSRILLVRHGETIWNHELRYQGHRDVPLSDVGRKQAQALQERLKEAKIDRFFSSDLSRARETAEIIANPHQKEVITFPSLRETNFGDWEGMAYHEIAKNYKELLDNWILDPENIRIPGGETLSEVAERCMEGLWKIVNDHKNETCLIVAHGGINRVIMARLLNIPLNIYWKIRQDNLALNVFDIYDGDKTIISTINDISHIRNIPL